MIEKTNRQSSIINPKTAGLPGEGSPAFFIAQPIVGLLKN